MFGLRDAAIARSDADRGHPDVADHSKSGTSAPATRSAKRISKEGSARSHRPGARAIHDRKSKARSNEPEGRLARDAAVEAVSLVLKDGKAFEDALASSADRAGLVGRDRAFARAIAASVLRYRGSLQTVIGNFLDKPLPRDTGRLEAIQLCAAVQLLVLKTPPHAAISIAVDQTRADRKARRFDKLTNAVLRRVSERGEAILGALDRLKLDIPDWMLSRWSKTYGAETARKIAQASLTEAALDLTLKDASTAEAWAANLGGHVLPTGSIRMRSGGRIEDLAGYPEGAWWVQDAAAALPAKLLGDVRGLDVADMCAAPGGKTAQLASLGARVVAVDQSEQRLARLNENLARLGLSAETVVADAAHWSPGRQFDAVLLDAPCTATGTMRRHPDILHLKRPQDVDQLTEIQRAILSAAARLLKPGGRLVYCTCSLEVEEGPAQFAAFLAANPNFSRLPIDPASIGALQDWITPDGDLRTLPHFFDEFEPGLKGMDGFYAAVARKNT
ncbi:MAG: RsmB/NOP family class I SAM-dependent RNA methyltransferase [Hyphomicrobium sp.]